MDIFHPFGINIGDIMRSLPCEMAKKSKLRNPGFRIPQYRGAEAPISKDLTVFRDVGKPADMP